MKSRLFTLAADKFLIFQSALLGVSNVRDIRARLLVEPLFRFDFYLKSLRETVLSKRISSLLKMLQNEESNRRPEKPKAAEKQPRKKAKSTATGGSAQKGGDKRRKKIIKSRKTVIEVDAVPPKKYLRKTKGARRKKQGEASTKHSPHTSDSHTKLTL